MAGAESDEGPATPDESDSSSLPDVDRDRFQAEITAYFQQNNVTVGPSVHLPVEDLERLLALPDDGQAYRLALRRIERQHESDIFLSEAAFRLPFELARKARPYALVAVVLIGALSAYFAHLGSTGKALGILLGVFVPLTLAFLGNQASSGSSAKPSTPDEDER